MRCRGRGMVLERQNKGSGVRIKCQVVLAVRPSKIFTTCSQQCLQLSSHFLKTMPSSQEWPFLQVSSPPFVVSYLLVSKSDIDPLLFQWQGVLVGNHRKLAKVPYPNGQCVEASCAINSVLTSFRCRCNHQCLTYGVLFSTLSRGYSIRGCRTHQG